MEMLNSAPRYNIAGGCAMGLVSIDLGSHARGLGMVRCLLSECGVDMWCRMLQARVGPCSGKLRRRVCKVSEILVYMVSGRCIRGEQIN
eukprot:scaffold231335_cov25-Prasinocladus_malaysianus.AAC.3